MNILVIIVAALLITSKFFDCYTTLKFYEVRGEERNPIARLLFTRVGVKKGIYLVFILSLLIIIAVTYAAFSINFLIYKISYIIIGGVISYIQFSVAKYNSTGKNNFIIRLIATAYNRIKIK